MNDAAKDTDLPNLMSVIAGCRHGYPEGHDMFTQRYADGYNDASNDIADQLEKVLKMRKPFAWWVKYANGYEDIIQRLPTDVDCEDMPSKSIPLYTD